MDTSEDKRREVERAIRSRDPDSNETIVVQGNGIKLIENNITKGLTQDFKNKNFDYTVFILEEPNGLRTYAIFDENKVLSKRYLDIESVQVFMDIQYADREFSCKT